MNDATHPAPSDINVIGSHRSDAGARAAARFARGLVSLGRAYWIPCCRDGRCIHCGGNGSVLAISEPRDIREFEALLAA